MLSTKNLPEPVNSTDVPLSMKIPRSIANPECRCTGQSTTNVKAPCRAAAKALMVPVVSSAVPPVQETQPLIDFLFAGAVVVAPLPAPPVDAGVGVDPAMAMVTGVPTVLMLDPSAVFVVLVAPDLSKVPVTAPAAVVPDDEASVELPCIDPHAASGTANAIDTTKRASLQDASWNRVTKSADVTAITPLCKTFGRHQSRGQRT